MKEPLPFLALLLSIFYVALFSLHDAKPKKALSQLILGDPSLQTCPTGNCPNPPILSTQFIHGATTKGFREGEWLSNIGLLVRSGAPNGQKVAQYIGAMQQEGAGTAWALNTNLIRNAGTGGPDSLGRFEGSGKPGRQGGIGKDNGSIGYELDFTNWDADSSAGHGPFTVGEYLHAQGSFTSLSAIYLDSRMGSSDNKAAWANGLMFNGPRVVSENTFVDATGSESSITIAGHHNLGLNTTQANADMHAIALRAGQTACFDGPRECVAWSGGKLAFTNSAGEEVFSIDERGNAFFKGHVFAPR